jgi:hypothetical protein
VPRRPIAIIALVLAAAAYFHFDVGRRARVDRGVRHHRTDFTVYQAAAHALVHGDDPYQARNPRGYRYVYPPLLAIALMPVGDWKPQHAALLFFAVSMLTFAAALVGLARLPGPGGRLGWVAVGAGVLVCLGFAHQGFQRGQVTHLLLGFHAGALVALCHGRHGLAGLCLALGGAVRLTPLLAAGAVGLGLLVHALRRRGRAPLVRFTAGVLAGLALGFVVLPVLALGPTRALEVGRTWIAETWAVHAEDADLEAEYRINEWRFKNQAPRRVYGTWLGWAGGRDFDGERPVWRGADDGLRDGRDRLAGITTWSLLGLAALLGACFLRGPPDGRFVAVFCALALLPVLMTRYAWPTHYLLALPAVAWAWGAGGRAGRVGVVVLLVGTALFYAAHAEPLQVVGEAGCLMLACAGFLALLLGAAPGRPAP